MTFSRQTTPQTLPSGSLTEKSGSTNGLAASHRKASSMRRRLRGGCASNARVASPASHGLSPSCSRFPQVGTQPQHIIESHFFSAIHGSHAGVQSLDITRFLPTRKIPRIGRQIVQFSRGQMRDFLFDFGQGHAPDNRQNSRMFKWLLRQKSLTRRRAGLFSIPLRLRKRVGGVEYQPGLRAHKKPHLDFPRLCARGSWCSVSLDTTLAATR